MDQLMAVAQQFTPQGRFWTSRELGRQRHLPGDVAGAAEPHFILQRLNLWVFPRPELVMENLATWAPTWSRRLALVPLGAGRRFRGPGCSLPGRAGIA